MIDHYKVLGVTRQATAAEIKKAYRKAMLNAHPDKCSDDQSQEMAKSLNTAYEILSDEIKRQQYDNAFFLDSITEDNLNFNPAGLIQSQSVRLSSQFKQQHARFVRSYEANSDHVQSKINETSLSASANFRIWLLTLERTGDWVSLSGFEQRELSPTVLIDLLQNFLLEKYSVASLTRVLPLLEVKVNQLREEQKTSVEVLAFYDGIIRTISLCLADEEHYYLLLSSLQKITDFAEQLAQFSSAQPHPLFIRLSVVFSSSGFRDLYAFALHHYWHSATEELTAEHLEQLNGEELARKWVDEKKDALRSKVDDDRMQALRIANTLKKFEMVNQKHPENVANKAAFYRDKGFLLIDWVPILSWLVDSSIFINTLFQAGICFQLASKEESDPAYKRADEKLACFLYLNAIHYAEHSSPSVRLTLMIHTLRLLSQCRVSMDEGWVQVTQELSKKVFDLAKYFPFYKPYQSNSHMMQHNKASLVLIRKYLHSLIALQQNCPEELSLDFEYAGVLYQMYEALLRNWFERSVGSETTATIRAELMQELLSINHWTFANVDALLKPPSAITVRRDPSGWLDPVPALDFPAYATEFYTSLKGVDINFKTGQVKIMGTPWQAGQDEAAKLFTWSDVSELFRKSIYAASFSLDPPDPNKSLHPFNLAEFRPAQLDQTQLLHTMLLADLLLKDLTVGYEAQASAPYDVRSAKGLVAVLPLHLQKIILDFWSKPSSTEVHRFWIAVDEMEIAEQGANSNEHLYVGLGQIKMCVKKHQMRRNGKGELIDVEHDDEGWAIYVISSSDELPNLRSHFESLKRPVLCWVQKSDVCYSFEEGQLTEQTQAAIRPSELSRLYQLSRDEQGKVEFKDIDSELFIYNLTKKFCGKNKLATYFSPEYVFAQEFTKHYDEFARFFPILGRLRELSKAVMMTEILQEQYLQMEHQVKGMTEKFKEVKELIVQQRYELRNKVMINLNEIKNQCDYYNLTVNEKAQVAQAIKSNYCGVSIDDVYAALTNWNQGIDAIVNSIMQPLLDQFKGIEETLESKKTLLNCFKTMGLNSSEKPTDVDKKCFWTPASVMKEQSTYKTRVVYGGVQINGRLNNTGNACLDGVQRGITVYRIWDGVNASPYGRSWTTVNPAHMQNARAHLGLPNANTARFVTEGVLINRYGVTARSALPCDGNPGGGPELVLRNAKFQVKVVCISGINECI